MFSALSHVPRGTVSLKPTGPSNVPAASTSASDFTRTQAYKASSSAQQFAATEATGKDLARFFARPRIPYTGAQVGWETVKLHQEEPVAKRPQTAATKDVGTQSDYR